MKKQLLILVGCLLAGAAFAADSVTLTDNSNASGGSYAAGASFTLNMNVTGTNPPDTNGMTGYSLWLAPGSSAWDSFFSVTGKTAGATFTDPNQTLTAGGEAIVTGGNTHDLGFTIADTTMPVPDASYPAADSLTITIGNSVAPGTYTIHSTVAADNAAKQTEVSDGNFAGHFVASSVYTITVVPEPGTLSLLGLGGLGSLGLIMIRARRRAS
jgi:hypothetical protein